MSCLHIAVNDLVERGKASIDGHYHADADTVDSSGQVGPAPPNPHSPSVNTVRTAAE
jgi:hypothetical protein